MITAQWLWDHPRVCGEHTTVQPFSYRDTGSSPRMRGTPVRSRAEPRTTGIIPAYAGNTCREYWFAVRRRDHPRVCGEHIERAQFNGVRMGSSPRMRGTRGGHGHRQHSGGIIPAYAGNTPIDPDGTDYYRDHPRVCGEHRVHHLGGRGLQGSSPRMRGTPGLPRLARLYDGIIPAYAGNTLRKTKRTVRARDHPRVCGEHAWFAATSYVAAGSSPRMRGTLSEVWVFRLLRGIIPAYAGNTKGRSESKDGTGDHPRVCGEHTIIVAIIGSGGGSSPRMRGTPTQR